MIQITSKSIRRGIRMMSSLAHKKRAERQGKLNSIRFAQMDLKLKRRGR